MFVWLQNRLLTFNAANLTAFMYLGCSGLFDFHLIWQADGSVAFKNWHNNYAGNGQRNECRTRRRRREIRTDPDPRLQLNSFEPQLQSAALTMKLQWGIIAVHTQGVGGGGDGAWHGCVGVECKLNGTLGHCALHTATYPCN